MGHEGTRHVSLPSLLFFLSSVKLILCFLCRSRDSISRYPNLIANRNLLVELLGALASIRFAHVVFFFDASRSELTFPPFRFSRFLTVTDRFLVELRDGLAAGVGSGTSGTSGKADREAEGRLDIVIRGMKGFKLKVSFSSRFSRSSSKNSLKIFFLPHRCTHRKPSTWDRSSSKISRPASLRLMERSSRSLTSRFFFVSFILSPT